MSKQLIIIVSGISITIASSFAMGFYIHYYQSETHFMIPMVKFSEPTLSASESAVVLNMLDSGEYQKLEETIEWYLSTEIEVLCITKGILLSTRTKIFYQSDWALSDMERILWKAESFLSSRDPAYKLPEECDADYKIPE